MKRRPWTAAEVALLRWGFADSRTDDMAAALGRSYSTVAQKAAQLGLRKSADYLASPEAHRLDGRKGSGTRFAKGLTPWNKGQPGSTGLHVNCKTHQFRPGRPAAESRNYVPIGTERLTKDGYLERKVTDDPRLVSARRWVAVHRLVWEAAHGPVPAGQVVVFRPGQKTTDASAITLDRIELVTRQELMRRNSYHTNLPKPLARVVQMRGALTRAINAKARQLEQACATKTT